MIKMVFSLEKYNEGLNENVDKAYSLAKLAKAKAYDPLDIVEIPLAKNMAERVERLTGVAAPQIVGKGIPDRIGELEKKYGKLDWRVALSIAHEVTQEKFCKFENKKEAIEIGIRVGFAYVTVGVVASPLEGFTGIDIRKRRDGKEYIALLYSGPVRSAGGTAASVSVLIADYIRKKMGYSVYDADENEAKRAITELTDYHERITNSQYFPYPEEIEYLILNLPVQIDGDPTEKLEVSNYKGLDRIATNKLRGGFCLVIGECLAQKAKKVLKQLDSWGGDFDLGDWNFMGKFCKLQTRLKAKQKEDIVAEKKEKVSPDYTFIKDIVAGRPVLTHPLCKGGFRLRYGRTRTTGLSATAIHPLTMKILMDYIAIGTQLKVERPGKSTVLSSCDYLEGPIVKLVNGDVVFLTEENYDLVISKISEILFLGDILIPYGDFLNRAHTLVPPGYCEEWWLKHLQAKGKFPEDISEITGLDIFQIKKLFADPIKTVISAGDAYILSKMAKVPLHPRYTYHWKDIDVKELLVLLGWLVKSTIKKGDQFKIIFPIDYGSDVVEPKIILEKLGIPHRVVSKEYIVVENEWAIGLMANLGIYSKDIDIKELIKKINSSKDALANINLFSEVEIKDKSGLSIGARMGRPEKAKMRKLKGSPHVLFPVGSEGGRLRSFNAAMDNGKIRSEFPIFLCESCNSETVYPFCEKCGAKTSRQYYCPKCKRTMGTKDCPQHEKNNHYSYRDIDVNHYCKIAKEKLGLTGFPDLVKGVRGVSNEERAMENLTKGILRSIHGVTVNKDGTVRYDMTEMPLTHFKPVEIGTSVDKLIKLGYTEDIHGETLVDINQIIQLMPQDVILPSCEESSEEGGDAILFRVAGFVDDLLQYFYGLERFYNFKSKEDLVGHLIISLAPHTSAGVVGRVIGFSKTQGCYASPIWHSAQRRDCDGDENGIMLLMDGLLNFSRKYLSSHRGATQDAPLVLTTNLILTEVDDMVFDVDCSSEYPLEFYNACEEYKMPWGVKIESIGDHLEEDDFKIGYTHEVSNLNSGVRYSAYKKIPTMAEKVIGQMKLAEMIRAVDENDVARLVIERHFIRDIKGNLRKFSMQQFRCVNCNEKYRRPPLIGKCRKCGGKLLFTISEGSVTKYLTPSLNLAEKYKVPTYTYQTLDLTRRRIESVFGKEADRQEGLGRWFG